MITLQNAKKAIAVAQQKARELGITVSVAIVDGHGTPVAIERMDNALTVSPEFALTKAYTSATLGMATDDIEPFAEQGKPYFGINTLASGKFTTIAGGLPIAYDGIVVGGVGVGGSQDVSQDKICARAAQESITHTNT